jgi:hypothetical protein
LRREHDARVDRDRPVGVGDQRIDVELDDLGQLAGELGDAQQHAL